MVAVAQLVVAPGCDPGGRGFKSPRSPHSAQAVGVEQSTPTLPGPQAASSSTAEQWTLNPLVLGSNPRGRTTKPQHLAGVLSRLGLRRPPRVRHRHQLRDQGAATGPNETRRDRREAPRDHQLAIPDLEHRTVQPVGTEHDLVVRESWVAGSHRRVDATAVGIKGSTRRPAARSGHGPSPSDRHPIPTGRSRVCCDGPQQFVDLSLFDLRRLCSARRRLSERARPVRQVGSGVVIANNGVRVLRGEWAPALGNV